MAPEVNVFETKDGYVLEAEMPGVTKSGLEITLEGNDLTFTVAAKLTRSKERLFIARAVPLIFDGYSNSIRQPTPLRFRRGWIRAS